jgi:hypothetical protein
MVNSSIEAAVEPVTIGHGVRGLTVKVASVSCPSTIEIGWAPHSDVGSAVAIGGVAEHHQPRHDAAYDRAVTAQVVVQDTVAGGRLRIESLVHRYLPGTIRMNSSPLRASAKSAGHVRSAQLPGESKSRINIVQIIFNC